ncbi:hypothetical protein LDENG_00002950 [Lucifuga dentata]|nr:hypothetical protein LDENG_00002950 [Lucifuga dentata]
MAASVRLLLCRTFRHSHRNITVSSVSRSTESRCCWKPLSCRCFSDAAEDRSTHFGFETVPEAEKAKRVYKVFESVAQKYDIMNDAMSLGIHRLWKDMLLHIMHPHPGARLLDVAGGTGDIAFRFLDYVRSQQERQQRRVAQSMQTPSWQEISNNYSTEDEAELQESWAVVCDINKEMLKVGQEKARSTGITTGWFWIAHCCSLCTIEGLSWVVGDAEELPFNDDQFDVYTIAFGIRNITHIDQALQEALRVLKPGGRFMCLEFSKVTNPVLAR